MSYYGDVRLGDTIDIKFTTRQISGAPFTLAGSPVISAYVGNGTTEITAGITLSVDFDSRAGLNNVRVVASSGNGFATATNVQLVITTGTVNSVSVVGEVVGEFSIECRSALMPTTASRTLDVSAGGEAGVDWANVGSPTTTLNLSGTTIAITQKVDVETIKTQAITASGGITFPAATLASTTNITAGTITTATNLTNAPTVGDLTATMKASVTTAATAATPAAASVTAAVTVGTNNDKSGYSLTQTFPTNFSALAITAGGIAKADLQTWLTTVPLALSSQQVQAVVPAATVVASVSGAVGSVTGAVGSVTGSVGSVTGGVTVTTNNDKTGYALTASYDFAKGTTAMTESYRANGAEGSPVQVLYEILGNITEASNAGTTRTVNGLNHATIKATYTYDAATPNTITRAT